MLQACKNSKHPACGDFSVWRSEAAPTGAWLDIFPGLSSCLARCGRCLAHMLQACKNSKHPACGACLRVAVGGGSHGGMIEDFSLVCPHGWQGVGGAWLPCYRHAKIPSIPRAVNFSMWRSEAAQRLEETHSIAIARSTLSALSLLLVWLQLQLQACEIASIPRAGQYYV